VNGRPPRLDVAGLVVLILAVAVAASLVIVFVALAIYGEHINPEGIGVLDTVAGAVIGVIAVFVGQRVYRGRSGPP
jgi:hypothetical protein